MTAASFALTQADGGLPRRAEDRSRSTTRPFDEHEFHRVYDTNAAALLRYLVRSTSNRDLAEDLLQEAFYRYVRSSFRGESEEHRRRFLFKVASNLVVDHYRRRRPHRVPLEEASAAASPDRDVLRADLPGLLARLSVRDRQLLWLAHVEGFSHKEVGHFLKLKPDSVRPALFRARKRLAEILSDQGIGPEVLGQ